MTKDSPKASHPAKRNQPQQHHGVESDDIQTYQDALDEAIEETFPASDPISPTSSHKSSRSISTQKNPVDWHLKSKHNKSKKT